MVVVGGTVLVKPESIRAASELCLWMTAETRVEPGCITYGFHVSLNDPNMIQVFEEWESMEDLSLHLATAHYVKFIEEIGPMLAQAPDVKIYEIASVRPL